MVDIPWYAIKSATSGERRAVASLLELGWSLDGDLQVYLPTETRWTWRREAKERVQRPLFQGYLFAQFGREHFSLIHDPHDSWRRVDGVSSIIYVPDRRGEPRPDHRMAAFVGAVRLLEQEGHYDRTRRGNAIKFGDKVRINQGPFTGYEGVVTMLKEGERRIHVLLNALGPLKVDVGSVEAAA